MAAAPSCGAVTRREHALECADGRADGGGDDDFETCPCDLRHWPQAAISSWSIAAAEAAIEHIDESVRDFRAD